MDRIDSGFHLQVAFPLHIWWHKLFSHTRVSDAREQENGDGGLPHDSVYVRRSLKQAPHLASAATIFGFHVETGNWIMLTQQRAAPQTGGRYAAVKTVSQVMLRLERDHPDPFKAVRDEVLHWVRWKAGKELPQEAWNGLTFELDDIGAQRVAAAHLDQPKYWAARVDDACDDVARRTWITEIGLAEEANGRLMFGCRLVVSARGENPRFQPSIPAFVRTVVAGGRAFLDERLISATPWIVHSEDDLDEFYRLLTSKSRRVDICAISLGEDDDDPTSAIVSVPAIHRLTLGAAHVAVLTGPAA